MKHLPSIKNSDLVYKNPYNHFIESEGYEWVGTMANSSFGQWLKRRRKALDMTQEELARRVGCAEVTIFKIEADQRRPSKQIGELLAKHLALPPADTEAFLQFARCGFAANGTSAPWGTAFHPPTNLPTAPTPLIGRERDIGAVRKSLLREDTQLLTLVGPPGIGKTRLSLAVAHEVLDEFSDGVFLVLLAPVTDPDLVPRTIVQALGLQEAGPHTSVERLTHFLRDKQMLLVLDNFEQILAAAPQIAELLGACPFIKTLVTSRAPLRIRRERQFPVPPLMLPEVKHLPEVEMLPNYAAIELFVERAQAVKPDFTLTQENGPSVAAICHRLDGLPLAIELISARVKLLPPAGLLERLHGRLLLASDGLRDIEPRHRTLNAAIGWSYDLLSVPEKTLFMHLGVFVGGCTLETVEAVCQPAISIVDGLASLLDKSLIQQKTGSTGDSRFTMLETIHEYALEKLAKSGDEQDLRRRHADYFLALAEAARRDAHDRIEQEHDNLQAALDWYWSNDVKAGVALVLAIGGYCIVRGRLLEGQFWAEKYLAACKDKDEISPENRRKLLSAAALYAYFQDDMARMRQHAETLLALGQERQDKLGCGLALFYLGQEALHQQDYGQANALFEQALSLWQQINAKQNTASALLMLALVAAGQQNYERADAYNAESLELSRQLGDHWGEGLILGNSGAVRIEQGNYQEARDLIRQALHISRQLNDKRIIASLLELLADLASLECHEHAQAARLMGAAEALRDSIFAPIEPLDRLRHDHEIERLCANLDEAAFAAAWTEGRLMTLEQAIEYALA